MTKTLSPDHLALLYRVGVLSSEHVIEELVRQGYRLPPVGRADKPDGEKFRTGIERFSFEMQVTEYTTPSDVGEAAEISFRQWLAKGDARGDDQEQES